MKLQYLKENNNEEKVTPSGLHYGGEWSEIDSSAEPIKVDKVNQRFLDLIGWELEEVIAEVYDILQNIEDEYTREYLEEQLPKLINATIFMKDVKEIAEILS